MRAKCPEIFLSMKDEPGYHFRILLVHKEISLCIYRMSQEEWTKLRESVP